MRPFQETPLEIAVIGSGVSGMSAAWLLSQRHRVTVYELEDRLGGHSHTVEAPTPEGPVPVDMGFIVYNEVNYPNLVALFEHLKVPTRVSEMTFGVSLDDGALEYGANTLATLFAQPRNLVSRRFWSMLHDIMRFYRHAPTHACALDGRLTTLGEYLEAQGYGDAFQDDHLLPQAAAIWSAPVAAIRDFPAEAFIRFCENHGLLKVFGRPVWRTVEGGSRAYVSRLTARYAERVRTGCAVQSVRRDGRGVVIRDQTGRERRFDHAVIAAHADQALGMLADPTPDERELLAAFGYSRNHAVLHADATLMPRRRGVWSSWNYVGRRAEAGRRELCVTYWMNRLQNLPTERQLFVTLNPVRPPAPGAILRSELYEHPIFDAAAIRAQRRLWSLQGRLNTWYCGAYFGAGFHEDGLQAGLATAEALGGVRRPWRIPGESSRIHVGPATEVRPVLERAA
jgi:predicted NAD/FAD-binding protein